MSSHRAPRRLSSIAALLLPALLFLLPALAAAPLVAKEMTAKEAKKVVKEAEKAVAEGDAVKARELYRLVIDGSAKAPESRADALYGFSLLEAARPADQREAEALERHLAAFLKDFPKDKRRPQIAAVAGLNRELGAAAGEKAALAAQLAEAEGKLKAYEEAATVASKDSGKKLDDAEAKARRLQVEVERLKGELAKQEEALKKLRKVVVGGG